MRHALALINRARDACLAEQTLRAKRRMRHLAPRSGTPKLCASCAVSSAAAPNAAPLRA
jgi:hypothetical protein